MKITKSTLQQLREIRLIIEEFAKENGSWDPVTDKWYYQDGKMHIKKGSK